MSVTADLFAVLGVSDPEGWAHAHRLDGTNQIARATALRALADIVAEGPALWQTQTETPATPEVRAAANRIAASGVLEEDLALVLQSTSFEIVFGVLALLSGAHEPKINPANVAFGTFALDDDTLEPTPGDLLLYESWRGVAADVLGPKVIAR